MTQPLTTQFHSSCHTPLGWIRAISNGSALIYLDWNQTGWRDTDNPDYVSRETIAQITAYFAGQRQNFNVPLDPAGASQSRRNWLSIMAEIPFGTTVSYSEFAAAAGKPKAARAAGSACATNPIPIIFPCHRVLRRDGHLGNYGGGSALSPTHPDNLRRKAYLIDHEKMVLGHPKNL